MPAGQKLVLGRWREDLSAKASPDKIVRDFLFSSLESSKWRSTCYTAFDGVCDDFFFWASSPSDSESEPASVASKRGVGAVAESVVLPPLVLVS